MIPAAADGPRFTTSAARWASPTRAGGNVAIPVYPATITVYPQAELQLNYFLQQDVIGEDPFDPQENIPSEPAALGLLVTNAGAGTANNLTITTAQPQIVQNEKGLLDTFQIIGTQVGDAAGNAVAGRSTSGTLRPGKRPMPTSLSLPAAGHLHGLHGHLHALRRSGRHGDQPDPERDHAHPDPCRGFQYPATASGDIDYLAEDNANPGNLPDTIYFSDGTTAAVNIATDVQSISAVRRPASIPLRRT